MCSLSGARGVGLANWTVLGSEVALCALAACGRLALSFIPASPMRSAQTVRRSSVARAASMRDSEGNKARASVLVFRVREPIRCLKLSESGTPRFLLCVRSARVGMVENRSIVRRFHVRNIYWTRGIGLPSGEVREPKTFDASDASSISNSLTVEYKKRPFGVLSYAPSTSGKGAMIWKMLEESRPECGARIFSRQAAFLCFVASAGKLLAEVRCTVGLDKSTCQL